MFFFFKQKTAYEMRISDWSSDVCSSDLFLVGLCQLEFCVVHRDGRLRLTYRCFLLRHTCGKPRDAGLGGSDLRLCRIHRNDEIPIVDRGDQIASLHWLVFFDQHLADYARHLGRSEEHTSELQSLMRKSYA